MAIGRTTLRAAGTVATFWDDLRYGVKARLGMVSPPILMPYRGYAANGRMRFGGRVIEDEGIVDAPVSRSPWTNLRRSFRRYETDEIRDAVIDWRFSGGSGRATTDRQGFFEIDVPFDGSPDAAWVPIELELVSAPRYEFTPSRTSAFVRIVSPEAEFGVISDMDDTVIETGARSLLRHWRTVALNSAEGRVAFPGVACLFQALASGRHGGGETNPVFYVSSSPWNLYDLFDNFLRLRCIPHGPMFLKDFGLDRTQWLTGSHRRHKLVAIGRILDAYPDLGFVLVGDTGQSDAKIYAEVVKARPGRIRAVFLRDVTPKGFRRGVRKAIDAIDGAGVPIETGTTLDAAARRGEKLGLVEAGTADRMAAEIAEDRKRLKQSRWPRPFGLNRVRAGRGSRRGPG